VSDNTTPSPSATPGENHGRRVAMATRGTRTFATFGMDCDGKGGGAGLATTKDLEAVSGAACL
jgi:hypothetical protein